MGLLRLVSRSAMVFPLQFDSAVIDSIADGSAGRDARTASEVGEIGLRLHGDLGLLLGILDTPGKGSENPKQSCGV